MADFLSENQARIIRAVFGLDHFFYVTSIIGQRFPLLMRACRRMALPMFPVATVHLAKAQRAQGPAQGDAGGIGDDGRYPGEEGNDSDNDSEADMYGWTPNPVAKAVIYEMQKKLGNDPAAWPGQRLPPILHEDFARAFPKRATLLEAAFVALFRDASLHKAWGDIESVWFLRVGDRRTGPGVHWH